MDQERYDNFGWAVPWCSLDGQLPDTFDMLFWTLCSVSSRLIILHIDLLFIASSTLAYVTATGLAFASQWLRRDFILSFFGSKEKQVQKLYMSRV